MSGLVPEGLDQESLEKQLAALAVMDEDALAVITQLAEAIFPDPSRIGDRHVTVWPEPRVAGARHANGTRKTDAERLEEQVQRTEARFRSIIGQLPAVVFLAALGNEENEVYVSPQIESLLGFTQDEWISNPLLWFQQLHPDDHDVVIDAFTRGVQTGGPFRAEVRFFSREGKEVWIHGEARLIRDEHGRPEYFQGVAFDLSASKEAQRRISEAERERSEVLAQSNAELSRMNVELRVAKEAAEQAANARSTFLSTMSHELRTPLNSVIVLAGLLAETELSEDQAAMIQNMQLSADLLLSVINDVLEFSRLRAGHVELDERPFDVKAWLEQTIAIVNPRAREKHITVAYAVDPDVPPVVTADDARLRQVLLNLLGNAVKFTPAGSVIASITAEDSGEGWELTCAVEDSGPGLSSAQTETLFDAFRQADAGVAREHGGTGLGLAISRQLIELLGGRIWAENRIGGGARFAFTWPCRVVDAPPVAVMGSAIPAEAVDGADIDPSRLRVLLVEDNETNRFVAGLVLRSIGFEAEMVESGEAAIAAIEASAWDVVLMDVSMPVLDGLAATRIIRKLGPSVHQPLIVAMTAHALPGDREACIEAGMDDYLAKPIDRDKLLAVLRGAAAAVAAPDADIVNDRIVDAVEKTLDHLAGLVGESWPPVLETFLIGHRERSETIRDALQRGDLVRAGSAAHSSRGSAGTIGAHRLADLAGQLETACRDGNVELAARIRPLIEPELDRLEQVLQARFDSLTR